MYWDKKDQFQFVLIEFFCQWAFGGSFSSINMSGAHSNPVVNGGGGGTFLEGQQAGAKK